MQCPFFTLAPICLAFLFTAAIPDRCVAQDRHVAADTYQSSYFEQFAPVTAFDIVRQVPGFRLSEGASRRGLGGAQPNVLIDGAPPPGKGVSIADELARIPAARVARVEIIRDAAVEMNRSGHDVLLNIILAELPDVGQPWRLGAIAGAGGTDWTGEATLRGNLSRWDYALAASKDAGNDFADGHVLVTRAAVNGAEIRSERELEAEQAWLLSGQLNGTVADIVPVDLSVRRRWRRSQGEESSIRTGAGGVHSDVNRTTESRSSDWNLGADARLPRLGSFEPKLIAVWTEVAARAEEMETVERFGADAEVERNVEQLRQGESIVRLEAASSGAGAEYNLGAEIAHNFIDTQLSFGPFRVPGADTKVDEWRLEADGSASVALGVDLKSTWSLGAEASRIRHSGDFERRRTFFFLKPSWTLRHRLREGTYVQLQLDRQIGQLSFRDFAASVSLDDDRVNLGNPELRPPRTWRVELAVLHQFSQRSQLELKLSREWISDLIDFLPLADGGEAVGNIGLGRVTGFEWEAFAPLDALGISTVRLQIHGRVKQTKVRDPVTQRTRRFSNERWGVVEIAYDQQLGPAWTWGWTLDLRTSESQYRIDEVERSWRGARADLFVQHALGKGMTVRLDLSNLTKGRQRGLRAFYDGTRRSLEPSAWLESARRTGRSIRLGINGTL